MKTKLLFACLWIFGLCSITLADLNDGLVAYYPFNGNANDQSGNGRDGIVFGATPVEDQTGQANSAYEFDGIDDYISFGNSFPDMDEMTLSIWLYQPSNETLGFGIRNIFVEGASLPGVKLLIPNDYTIEIHGEKNGYTLKNQITIAQKVVERWVNITWIMTGTYSKVYLDGTFIGQADVGGSNVGEHAAFLGIHLLPGFGPFGSFWPGKVSSLRIYDRVLSEPEIVDLFNTSDDPDSSDGSDSTTSIDLNKGLVLFCPFNGNPDDQSENRFQATVFGATLTKDQNGNDDSAYAFDGVNDYIYYGPVLPDMEQMTVALWLFIPEPDGIACIFSDTEDLSLKMDEDYRIKIVARKNGARLAHGFNLYESLYSNSTFSITNRWIHMVWVMNEHYSIIYVDGIARGQYSESGSNVGRHDLQVGVAYWGSSGQIPDRYCWQGKISSLRFYDRALNESEILALYEAGRADGGVDRDDTSLLYVDDDAQSDPGPSDLILSDPNEEGTVEHPYDSIQEAIEAAQNGHKIVVRSGTYYETIDFLGKSIHVTGFDPNAETQSNQLCPVIDGNYQDTVVTFASGEDPNAQLSGFTITRGFGRYAGGIFCSGSHPRISNCLIVGNRSESLFGGGAVYCSNSNAVFDSCTMSGNYGGQAGAGFYIEDSQNSITNSILWDNLPAEIGFPMFGGTFTPPMLTYCDLTLEAYGEGNLTVDPLFESPGYWAEASNPDVPTDAANSDVIWIAGNYHLMKESPCIDAGDPNSIVDTNQFDLDGHPRLINDRIDMGADEYISIELNFTAIYNDIHIPLSHDTNVANPETTFIGTTTIQLDASFRLMILGQAFATSDAGGRWAVTISPDIIGPGMDIDVEVTIKGTDVDIGKLTATSGDIVLADIEIGGILAL